MGLNLAARIQKLEAARASARKAAAAFAARMTDDVRALRIAALYRIGVDGTGETVARRNRAARVVALIDLSRARQRAAQALQPVVAPPVVPPQPKAVAAPPVLAPGEIEPTLPRSDEWKAAREKKLRERAELAADLARRQQEKDRGGREAPAPRKPDHVSTWLDVVNETTKGKPNAIR